MRSALAGFLLIAGFALPLSAWAVDTDGDGVDDSIDAFPTYPEATTDTDGDGQPDVLNNIIFQDSFEGSVASGWTGVVTSGAGWSMSSLHAHSGYQSLLGARNAFHSPVTKLIRSVTIPAQGGTISYWHKKDFNSTYPSDFNGIANSLFTSTGWVPYTKALGAGVSTLTWTAGCNGTSGPWDYYCGYLDDVTVRFNSSLVEDTDDDNDGVSDGSDQCPLDPVCIVDTDGDGIDNAIDADDDNDTVLDGGDNCLLITNADQADDDQDGIGNACDSNGPGKLDFTFGSGTNDGNTIYYAVAAQADGKVLIGGSFVNGIARLNANRYLDAGFSARVNSNAYAVIAQADGKVLVGGSFTTVNGVTRNGIARLNSDGSSDIGFNSGAGASSTVTAIALQTDNKVLIGGYFGSVNGVARNRVARLNSDGSLDTSFNPGTGVGGNVNSVALQADGKVLIGGAFTSVNGVARNRIARLNADGSLDADFNPGTGADGIVRTVALQADGKVLIGGGFTTVNGVTRSRIARLNADGSLDNAFNTGTNFDINTSAVQADGKILIAGDFAVVNGVSRNRIARLNLDGSLDTGFNPGVGANNIVFAMAIQTDGKLLVSGDFTSYNGTAMYKIARVDTGDADFDGIKNGADYFSNNAAAAFDTDRDGLPDAWLQPNNFGCAVNAVSCNGLTLDNDGDNDGLLNENDNCPVNINLDQLNADGDAQGDVCDADDDNDGVADTVDKFPLNIAASSDTDVDGFPGSWNAACDAVCQSNSGLILDNCPSTSNANQLNTDGDALGDVCDADDDNDGVADGADTYPLNPAESADSDNDGTGNNADPDDDNDTLLDGSDNCPLHVNADQQDDDNDGVGNPCDSDGPGKLDTSFNPGVGANSNVRSVVLQKDGKVLVGGYFTAVNGVTRNRIARLNSDGSLDANFNPGTGANDNIYSVALQADGKVLIGGAFTTVNGVSRNRIARLNSDGSLDASFNPGTGASIYVSTMTIQTDGKVLIGGNFTTVNSVSRNCIARLNSDGSLDTSFNPGTGANASVSDVALQTDGKILIIGSFTTVNGVSRNRIARLNSDGSLDADFNPVVNLYIYSVASQVDGKVLIAGTFTTVNGLSRNGIARLNSDGSLDTAFNHGAGAYDSASSVVSQADGKVLIGGSFTTVNGVSRNGIARLNSDGSLDTGFNPDMGASSAVYSVALQADGKALIGGDFTYYNGTNINRIARIHTGDADQDGIEDGADYFSNNAAAALDTDRDGLPDAWLQPNIFGCVASANSCNGLTLDNDNDNDGAPDYLDPEPLNAANNSVWPLNSNYQGSAMHESQVVQ